MFFMPVSGISWRPNERCENESTQKENQSALSIYIHRGARLVKSNRCKNEKEKGRLHVRVLCVVFVKARRTLFKSWAEDERALWGVSSLDLSFKRPLKKE